MKKLFLFLTMFLFALTGVTRAEQVEIGAGVTANTSYFPTYTYYNYSLGQQLFLADEIGTNGYLAAISFNVMSGNATRHLKVYMKEVEYGEFASTSAWETFAEDEYYFDGDVDFAPGWVQIMLDNSFNYTGEGNLLVSVVDETGSWVSAIKFYAWNKNEEYCRLNTYRDTDPFDVTNPGVTGGRSKWKNNVKLLFMGAPELEVNPLALDFGYRPIGAWMEGETITVNNLGATTSVTTFVPTNSFFTTDVTVPFTIGFNEPVELGVSTGTGAAGVQEGQLVIAHAGGAALVDLTATAYEPVDGDVWETAVEVSEFPYQGNAATEIYKNYNLPGMKPEAKDVIYKVTFDNDVLFTAGTNGDNATTALYAEDFNGEPGPKADNTYAGIPVNEPNLGNLFTTHTYDFEDGTLQGWTNLDADGDGYEWMANTEYGGYDGSTGLAYSQSYNNDTGVLYPDNYLISPAKADYRQISLWACGQDANYAAEHFGIAVSTTGTNAADFTTIAEWTIGAKGAKGGQRGTRAQSAWTQYNVDLSAYAGQQIWVAIRHFDCSDQFYLDIDDVKLTSFGGRGNRDSQTVTVFDGTDGNSYVPVYGFYADAYLRSQYVIPATDLAEANGYSLLNATLYLKVAAPEAWTGTFQVYLKEVEDATISAFIDPAEATTVYTGTFDATGDELVIPFDSPFAYNGGNLLVGVDQIQEGNYKTAQFAGVNTTGASVQGYSYSSVAAISPTQRNFGPKTTFEYVDPNAPIYQINDMFLPTGTYYLAVASSKDNFQVDMTATEAPAPEQAVVTYPADGATNIATPFIATWELGEYTTEYQVLIGQVYPPTTVLVDWTNELSNGTVVSGLHHNKTYFMQINARNASGTTYGEITGFTTVIDGVNGFAVDDANLYPGEHPHFTWNANRSIKGYNMYLDGVKVNENLITEVEYTYPEDLAYNMLGYNFQITAVYDEGESALSEPIEVFMTGFGAVNGHVWEQDSITPVALAYVEMRGLDEYGVEQTFSFPTNPSGFYEGELLAGVYTPTLVKPGYQESEGAETTIVYDELAADVDIVCYEMYYALQQIKATEMVDDNNVLVEWDWTPATMIVDFETGDLSQADFSSTSTHPWEITTTNPYEGVYAIKSTCEGVASGSSEITATVDVPFDAKMGFYVKVSTEANYDKFYFYIDGVQQGGALSGNANYVYKEYAVAEGTHTYTWKYEKDSSVNSNDDCVYVDYITMYRQDQPMPGGQTYDFDDSTMQGWSAIDGGTPAGYGWQVASDKLGSTGYGHDGSTDCVLSQSYDNNYGVVYPDNYLVSPSKLAAQNGAYISFWACGQDASYAAEHFGVAVSTGSATAADFTTIQEWTMTAKSDARTADAFNYVRGTRAQGNWYEYTVDLSSYAGQQIWVAIRHFNCSDMFYLDVDDITLSDGSAKGNRGDRMLDSYKLYRRDVNGFVNYDDAEAELIATLGTDVYSYTDNAWANLPYGMYQWGIQAKYEGNQHPLRSEVVIGEGTTTSTYLPAYYLYNYSFTEQIYTAAEIGTAGTISSISFSANAAWDYDLDIYMVNTSKASFEGATDWVAVTAADKVYSGAVSFVGGDWTTITLDTPFNYNGSSNLLVVVDNNTGDWGSGGPGFLTFAAEGAQAIYAYNDYTNYDPASPSGNGTTLDSKNQIKLNISGGGQGGNNGLSEMIWSNVIEKDMYSTVTFDITLNNGQAPLGAVITMEGEEEDYTATCDDPDGIVVIENVRKGEYEIVVALAGYTSWGVFDLIDEDEEVYDNILLVEQILGVSDLYVSPTGWAMWNGIPNDDRAPVKYKVMLDGVIVDEVENMFYQIDVDDMEEGETHITSVAALYATGLSDYADYTWEYTPCENFAGATEWSTEVIGNDVTVSFELPGGGVTPQPGTGDTFSVNFDDSQIPAGWTMIDGGTPSGYGWQLASTKLGPGYGHNGSADCILSQSYDNNYGVVYPDNYFISPSVAITTGSTFSFWACGQDASYAAEHFGVAVSTTGTNASDFTMVNEWTMTAKGSGVMAPGRDGQTRAQGNWYQYSVDLSSYAGQNVYIAIRHFNCSDMFYLDVDDLALAVGTKGNRAMWDYVASFSGSSAGQQAVATDGNYIYTASWQATPTGGHTFYQYNMDGTFVEGFDIAGATGIRDLTTDGEYFYGTSGGAQIFILDFTTRTLVGTINCSGLTSRHISYDPERDGFWSGNWSTLALYSRSGAVLQSAPAPTSAYGSAYYKDSDNVEHLFLFCQPNSDAKVYDYNITTNTIGTSPVLDFASTPGFNAAIAGGCFIGAYNGNTCWYGNAQQDPNLIGIYEIEAGTPGPGPGPQPTGDVLGAFVFVDGELFTMEPATTDVVISDLEEGEHEICIRVVYSNYAMSCMDCMTVEIGEVICEPVTNLEWQEYTYQGNLGILLTWTGNDDAIGYDIYADGEYLGTTTYENCFFYEIPDGQYTFGIVAVYDDCESDMETIVVDWQDVEDNAVVNAIYPNPTSDNLTIKANAMTRVSVYNAMGQMVYDQALNADETIINMGQFEAGVYMVSIQTENGTSVKRVTVVK